MGFLVPRDEREAAVDHAADRLSYLVLSFGLLVVVAYRGLVRDEASWDLLGLIVLGGLVGTVERARRRAVTRSWMALLAGTAVIALGVAAIVVLVTRR